MNLYKIVKPIIFKINAETAHNLIFKGLGLLETYPSLYIMIKQWLGYSHSSLKQSLFNLEFKTPVGIPAGADKHAKVPNIWDAFSFGFTEIGSVTLKPQPGNPKPRLWRLIPHKSICVYMGLNSEGAEVIKTRLAKKSADYPVGANIARTTNIPQEDTVKDYVQSFKILAPLSDFISLNVSCPNVQDFSCLQRTEFLQGLLEEIEKANQEFKKPIFVKIGPDNSDEELKEICDLAIKYNVNALICTNLTKIRDKNTDHIPFPGGLSGKLVEHISNTTIRKAYQFLKGSDVKIIGVGGIFTAEDAYQKIKLGASLVQLYTGFIYEGPGAIKKINQGLVNLLSRDGFSNISEAVGIDNN